MTVGGVSRLAPVGMPAVVVDGVFILTPSASARGSALVTLSTTFPSGWLFYTLDGSDPAASGTPYAGPFTVRKGSVLRTIAYNSDFTQSVAGDPVSIVILPTLTGLTDGGGSVAIEPPAGDYFSNSQAVVTATPAPGWTFLQWLGDASGANPVVNLSMTRNKTVRAVFGASLNTTVVGGGSIVTSPLSPWYPYGSQVRLTAVPATGNYFDFWANAADGQTNDPLTFTVTNANPTVTAVFASLGGTKTNALTVIPDGRGQVTLMPPGNRFPLNTNVVLQATPDVGQEFLGWSGAASGSENPLVVTMNSNKVLRRASPSGLGCTARVIRDLLSQDGFRLTLTGEFGAAYQILGSTDCERMDATRRGNERLGHGAVHGRSGEESATAVLQGNGGIALKTQALLPLLLLLALPAVVQAQFLYETNNGTITIWRYNGPGGAVTIPDTIDGLPVTSIGGLAFFSCTSLTYITIPDSVTSIEDNAFESCTNLTGITFSTASPALDRTRLFQCISLTSITIPDSVTNIGGWVFAHCYNLTSVTIRNNVTNIGTQAFNWCTNLASVTIGNSLTSIGTWAFNSCISLTNVTIPNSVTSIGDDAFYDCSSLTRVTISDSVTNIGQYSFFGCSSLTSITIPGSVTSLGSRASLLLRLDQRHDPLRRHQHWRRCVFLLL